MRTPRGFSPAPASGPATRRALAVVLSASAVTAASAWGQPPSPSTPGQAPPADINKAFENPNVAEYVKKFEAESREVYARREAIVEALGLARGMAVADVGAGTGLFTRLIAEKVGPSGVVYAVDVSRPFLKHIDERSKALGQTQVKTLRGTQTTTNLPAGSVDLVFLCDVYHHVEKPALVLASIHEALRPGGHLVVIDFDREKARNSEFIRKHVRADRRVFVKEILDAGFVPADLPGAPELKENFFLKFRRVERVVGE